MSKVITAEARITASDKTGAVLDKLAAKFRGVEKTAKAMEGIRPLKFTGNLDEELRRLKLTERELNNVRKAQQAMHSALLSDPVGRRASHYFRAMDDWKNKTVNHWREVKASVNETDRAHRNFFAAAGRFGLAATGIGGGAFLAGRVAQAGVKAAAVEQRESARDYLAGMSDAESQRIRDESIRASQKYQSVDSSTMHERLRDTAMGMRSTDKAIELADTIGEMTTVLQSLKGKDAAIEEGRKFFAALDVLGKNIDPKEVRSLADGYIKALGVEGADMDLAGMLTMARQSRAAGGILSNRFLTTTAPGLARDLGDPQLGTALASALSQNIGGRATEASKEAQREFGLRDKSGNFLDSRLAMSDPDKYAWERLIPALQKKGVDVNDGVKVTEALSKMFSNRVVGDVLSKMITQREQYQAKAEQYAKAPGLSAAGPMMTKDPFVAHEAVFAQFRTLASQAPIMDATAAGLNKISGGIVNLNNAINEGAKDGGWLNRFGKEAEARWETTKKEADVVWGTLKRIDGATSIDPTWLGLGQKNFRDYPAADDPMGKDYSRRQFHSDAYWAGLGRQGASAESAARLRREAERFGAASQLAAPGLSKTMTYGTGVGGGVDDKSVSVSGEVHGEVKQLIEIQASHYFEALVRNAQNAIQLSGQINSNGVGSTGRSSPDAAAPSHVGSAGNLPL